MLEVRYWEDVVEGMPVMTIDFPITVHRLVVEAGANRDFGTVHHNADVARRTGAPDCFANNVFIQAMLERVAREFIGLGGVIRKIGPFRMHSFLAAGCTASVSGSVKRKWITDGGEGLVEISLQCATSVRITASGTVTAKLPRRPSRPSVQA